MSREQHRHAFVVPAYGRSAHFEDCLASLAAQSTRSPVVVCTSTPFDGIDAVCERFGARLVCHSPSKGIGNDWNAALASVHSDLVTIAHQDDVYLPDFVDELLEANARHPASVLYFCDAEEMTQDGRPRQLNRNNDIKKRMVSIAFAGRRTIGDPLSKRMLLGFGNPIVCPAVSINTRVVPGFRFRENLRTNMDWMAWLDLTSIGPVTRLGKVLMKHRVHDDSETSRCLTDGARLAEDRMAFEHLWSAPIAKVLTSLYSKSYAGYSE